MSDKYKVTDKVKSLIQGTDSARKRDFYMSLHTSDKPVNTASYWCGGSRDCYIVINIHTGARITPPAGTYPTFQAEYVLQPGDVIMQTGFLCGKPATPTFTCLPEDNNRVRAFLGLPIQLSGNMVTVEIERETEVIVI